MADNKYQRGKIYKIVSNQNDLVYYGSTIEDKLTNRLSGHRTSYRRWLSGEGKYITSFEIVKFDDAKIILVETFPCNTVYELTARENYYIENNQCINKQRAPTGLSRADYYQKYRDDISTKVRERYNQNKEEYLQKQRQYREENKEKCLEQQRVQYHKHKEKNKEKRHQYVIEHREQKYNYDRARYSEKRDEILMKCKEYKEKNKEKLFEKFICACGGKYVYKCKSIHEKSKKHQEYLKTIEN